MKEFDWIRKIKKQFPQNWENTIGNDCAIFQINGNGLITKDLLVEGTHFYPDIPLEALAYKSLVVNMSDIYSDGGIPKYFVIGIGARKEDQKRIEKLYQYYSKLCLNWNIPIIGGDTVFSPVFFISVTCVGETLETPWLRKNAEMGDWIYVTGDIGASSYGLEKIKEMGHDLKDKDIQRHLFPPCLSKIPLLLKNRVHAAVDISDGFLQDLSRILEESGKGARIEYEKIPFSSSLPSGEMEKYAFYGGEDYEIIFTSPEDLNFNEFLENHRVKISKIGKVIDKKEIQLQKSNKISEILLSNIKGYDHWIEK